MKSPFRPFFQTEKQHRLFLLMCLATLLDFALVGGRLLHTGYDFGQIGSLDDLARTRSDTFLFLGWNLFLAWIPYCIAVGLERVPAKRWLAVPALAAWLVFFPNAPYIVTDLLHVHHRYGVPLWYDTMMIFSFAWTGLMLGYLSLMEVQRFLAKRLSKNWVACLTWAAIGLCAFGVYVGRYQRWNSWDLLSNPYQLFWDLAAVLLHPFAYAGTLGLAVVMAGVLGVGHLTMKTLVSD